jgi:hypothetical protein
MQVPIQLEDVQLFVVLVFVDSVERNLNDCGDDLRNFIANRKLEIVVHHASSFESGAGAKKNPCVSVGVISRSISEGA